MPQTTNKLVPRALRLAKPGQSTGPTSLPPPILRDRGNGHEVSNEPWMPGPTGAELRRVRLLPL